MCVSRSEVSSRCSIQRESLVTGAKAMSASFEGSGPGSELVRTKRSRSAAGCWPGSTGSYRENGASGGERETLRGPVRRSIRAAMFTRQEAAACVRSAGRSSTRASFSASAKVSGETSGPTAGPVPKAEGAPGGSCDGACASALRETAAPRSPSDVFARNCLRESGMGPPRQSGSIVSGRRPRRCKENPGQVPKEMLVSLGRILTLDLGRGNALLIVHRKQQVILETMAAMRAAASPIVKDFRCLRQPHAHLAGLEMHGTVFDGRMVSNQADFRPRGNQIRFQPGDLKAVRGDPGASLEGNRVGGTLCSNLIGANGIRLVRPLAEVDLPGGQPVRPRQSLTRERKVLHVERVKDKR